MKKIIFLILFSFPAIIFAQVYQIQIRLVDAEVGYPTGDPIGNNYAAESNDTGLNAIFDNHNATSYYPGYDFIPVWETRTHFVLCDGCNINQFEQDLLNYDSVIAGTFQSEPFLIANNLGVKLLNPSTGNPTGDYTTNGNVITTNAAMNTLFETHNVVYFNPSYGNGYHYALGCNCEASELMYELNSLTNVIEYSERVGYAILDTPENDKLDFKIYPNPVNNKIVIDSSEKIIAYEIINLLGQAILKVNSEENLNKRITSLASGTYLLSIVTDSGKKQTIRFLKE